MILNFMEIGMGYGDVVNTVSPTYAEEIKYAYFCEGGLNGSQIENIFMVFLNGIDTNVFNPGDNKRDNSL